MTAPRRRRSSAWLGWGIAAAAVAASVVLLPRAMRKKPIPVKTVHVERGTVRDVVASSAAGEVVPLRHATVRAELGARVVAVKHERGDRVKRGDPVVIVDAGDLDARISQAQATLAANTASLGQATARVDAAQRTADRARGLAQRGAGTTQLSEDSEAALREAKEAVKTADGLRAQAEAALRVARVARGKAEIDAPFDGTIVELKLDPGEELSPSAVVFEIIDDSKLHVEASIDEADIGRVRTGQPATLTLDAIPGVGVPGLVSKIGPAVRKDLKGARTLPIDVDVANPRGAVAAGIRSGMSADVEIIVDEKPNVISLPTNVIIGRGAHRSVYVVADGKAHLRSVEVGLSNWDKSEIVSGVTVGEEVVATLNAKDFEDGVAVRPGAVGP